MTEKEFKKLKPGDVIYPNSCRCIVQRNTGTAVVLEDGERVTDPEHWGVFAKETKSRPKSSRKGRATFEELKDFCSLEGLPFTDAEWLFEKWEGNGWKNNGKPIVNWKSTIRTWRRWNYLLSQKHAAEAERPTPGIDKMVAHEEYKRVLDRMKFLTERYRGAEAYPTWTPADQAEMKRLRQRRDELKRFLRIEI
jgi:hypothetical protein